jgi:hypothetical protein
MEKDSFADMSEKEFRDLKRQAPWLKEDYFDANEMNEFVNKVSTQVGRKIQLSSYVAEVGLEALCKSLDTLVLYQEIRARYANLADKTPLVHQRTKHSQDHQRLFKWDIFNSTETFIMPIQYRVKNKKRNTVSHPSTSLFLSNKELGVVVQDKLIESHFEPTLFIVPELVEPIERVLTTTLINIVVFRGLAFFFFEWIESMQFLFVMAFKLSSLSQTSRRLIHHSVVTLHRKDVMEFFDNPDPDIQEDASANTLGVESDKKQKKKSKKSSTKKTTAPLNLLQSLTNEMAGYHEDDNDDEEEDEAACDDMRMDVEEPIIASKVKHISSSTAEEEFVLKPFIVNLRTSHISYLTCAYVKRD